MYSRIAASVSISIVAPKPPRRFGHRYMIEAAPKPENTPSQATIQELRRNARRDGPETFFRFGAFAGAGGASAGPAACGGRSLGPWVAAPAVVLSAWPARVVNSAVPLPGPLPDPCGAALMQGPQ